MACVLSLGEKIVLSVRLSVVKPLETGNLSKKGQNIEIYFNGFSHPNCATAEYVGEVVFYDEESWASRNLNILIRIISYCK